MRAVTTARHQPVHAYVFFIPPPGVFFEARVRDRPHATRGPTYPSRPHRSGRQLHTDRAECLEAAPCGRTPRLYGDAGIQRDYSCLTGLCLSMPPLTDREAPTRITKPLPTTQDLSAASGYCFPSRESVSQWSDSERVQLSAERRSVTVAARLAPRHHCGLLPKGDSTAARIRPCCSPACRPRRCRL